MRSRMMVQLLYALTCASLLARRGYRLEVVSVYKSACEKLLRVYKRLLPRCAYKRVSDDEATYPEIVVKRLACLANPHKKVPAVRVHVTPVRGRRLRLVSSAG